MSPVTSDLPSVVNAAATQRKLKSRLDLHERGWAFWELRNINMHRVVGLFRPDGPIVDVGTLNTTLRDALARNFKRAWWRGIAYGVVADAGAFSPAPDDLKVLVDSYENTKGTMQWVVLVDASSRKVTGVHNWIEGYLGPVYRAVLQSLASQGYQISSIMKDKDGLLRFLTAVADARSEVLTGRPTFPEFQDPFARPGNNSSTRSR
jgi:hypothetical protein